MQKIGPSMPINCKFKLDKREISSLQCEGVGEFAAFSGRDGISKNNADYSDKLGVGPLPVGRYYIVDRGSGGFFSRLYTSAVDWVNDNDHSTWFALYRDDGKVDDETFVNGVRRGNFRLHPHGRLNISEGCITLSDKAAFIRLRKRLLGTVRMPIPDGTGFAYGVIEVTE